MIVIESVYVGLFVAPILLGALPACVRAMDYGSRRRWLLFAGSAAIIVGGVAWFWGAGRHMPYVPHFLGAGGPGSGDLRASRPPLFDSWVYGGVTLVCAGAAIGLTALAVRALERRDLPARSGAGLLVAMLGWQAIGTLPQSFLFRNWIVSLDRYLLPLLPLSVLIALWLLEREWLHRVVVWTAIAAVGLFSVLGTRDALVFQGTVWSLARGLNAAGVANTRLDAGYAWDAYHLWEFGDRYDIPPQTPDGPWWTTTYAPATDSAYVIAGRPLEGYVVLSIHRYSAWLHTRPMYLFVLRRADLPSDGVIWPPNAATFPLVRAD
jgi:hypothetical protein